MGGDEPIGGHHDVGFVGTVIHHPFQGRWNRRNKTANGLGRFAVDKLYPSF